MVGQKPSEESIIQMFGEGGSGERQRTEREKFTGYWNLMMV